MMKLGFQWRGKRGVAKEGGGKENRIMQWCQMDVDSVKGKRDGRQTQ